MKIRKTSLTALHIKPGVVVVGFLVKQTVTFECHSLELDVYISVSNDFQNTILHQREPLKDRINISQSFQWVAGSTDDHRNPHYVSDKVMKLKLPPEAVITHQLLVPLDDFQEGHQYL